MIFNLTDQVFAYIQKRKPVFFTCHKKEENMVLKIFIKKVFPFILMLFPVLSSNSTAGGPMNVSNGSPVLYNPSAFPVVYHLDQTALGEFSNQRAVSLADECFQVWEDVETASIYFSNGGFLPEVITANNYSKYLDNYYDGYNPVIFDSDGAIIEAEYGEGSSGNIMGFAGSAYSTSTGYYIEGVALLNGRFSSLGYDNFKGTFVHEFGHFIGLDHCQINSNYASDRKPATDIFVPTMYPFSVTDDSSLGDLNPDDKAAITLLYPSQNWSSHYGRLQGRVLWGDGTPVLGANVVAFKTGDEDMSRFSSVSDYYKQQTGGFEIPVSPGTYTLYIEPIETKFTGGSSVGPYAGDLKEPSFTYPVEKKFYSRNVYVAAGQTVSDIIIYADDEPKPEPEPEPEPVLSVSPDSIDFGDEGVRETLLIQNSGKGTLQWSIVSSASWLMAGSSSGEISAEIERVMILCDREGLGTGEYSAELRVFSNNGSKTVNVFMTIAEEELCLATNLLGEDDPGLDILRQFRDRQLAGNSTGKLLIDIYYELGKEMRAICSKNPYAERYFQKMLELIIPVVEILNKYNGEEVNN